MINAKECDNRTFGIGGLRLSYEGFDTSNYRLFEINNEKKRV